MRTRLALRASLLSFASVAVLLAGAGCANSVATADDAAKQAAGKDDPVDPEAETEENAPPHALGTIVLGEQHSAADGLSTPLVSVSFVPDAKLVKACTRKVSDCPRSAS